MRGCTGEACGPSTRGTGGFLPRKHQLSPLSLGNSRLPFLPGLGSFVPIENVSPVTSCPNFRTSLEPQGSSLEAESPQEQISALSWFVGWLGDFGSSQAHQLPPGTSQTGPSAVHPEKGLVETPFGPIFGSTWAEGLQPGLCETLGPTWTPHELGGAVPPRGAPAPGAVCGEAGMAPCTSIPPAAFPGHRAPGCALIPYCLKRIGAKASPRLSSSKPCSSSSPV